MTTARLGLPYPCSPQAKTRGRVFSEGEVMFVTVATCPEVAPIA